MKITAALAKNTFKVRETCRLELAVQVDCALAPGDTIEIQFPQTWSVVSGPSFTRQFQCIDPAGEHYVTVATSDGFPAAAFRLSITNRTLHYPAGSCRHGRLIVAELTEGAIPAGTPIAIRYANTFAPYVAETELLWLRVKGQTPMPFPLLQVTPDEHRCFRVMAPSSAAPGQDFSVLIVSLDQFENASCTQFRRQRLFLNDGSTVAEGLDFCGSCRVQTRLEKPGVYRFRLGDTVSNAIKVDTAGGGPYWGDIHIHTKLSHDGQGTNPYQYARQVGGLDFAGVADHWESLGPDGYRMLLEWAEDAHVPGTFVTIPADERNPRELHGHHNIYFHDPDVMRRFLAIQTDAAAEPANSFRFLRDADPGQVMLIPHHTGISFGDLKPGNRGGAIQWDITDDHGLRPVMEIYSHHGQSEVYNPQHLLAYEWNRMRNPERRANTSVPGPHYAQNYWMAGHRIGVIGSSDEHSGQGGRRHGGIAAVFADALSRKDLFQALRNRRCYATTGERILVDFSVDGLRMGECGTVAPGRELDVTVKVWGTNTLLRVEILRHRFGRDQAFVPIVSFSPRPEGLDAEFSCRDLVEGPCMYYARIVQEPIEWPAMAWTSPVWIDVKS